MNERRKGTWKERKQAMEGGIREGRKEIIKYLIFISNVPEFV